MQIKPQGISLPPKEKSQNPLLQTKQFQALNSLYKVSMAENHSPNLPVMFLHAPVFYMFKNLIFRSLFIYLFWLLNNNYQTFDSVSLDFFFFCRFVF